MQSLKDTAFWSWLREEPDHQPVVVTMPEGEAMIRRRFVFVGQVQGVGFRYVLKEAAEVFALTGHAANEEDGTVTAEWQGSPLDLENAVHYIQLLSPYILIDEIRQEALPLQPEESTFTTA